jgi:large subunit ribosomal protein L22
MGGFMEARAVAKYVRISPRKANQILELIRGLPVDNAEEVLQFSPKPFAKIVNKILKSAVNNMTQKNDNVDVESLVVLEAVAGSAPTIKKIMPRARGRASRIFRRFAHIRIVVEGPDDEESED